MSSQTPNINLTLPTGAEKVSRQIINDNNTKIDTAIGTLNGKLSNYAFGTPFNLTTNNQNNYTTPMVTTVYDQVNSMGWCTFIVAGKAEGSHLDQVLIGKSDYAIRSNENGTWSSWVKVLNSKIPVIVDGTITLSDGTGQILVNNSQITLSKFINAFVVDATHDRRILIHTYNSVVFGKITNSAGTAIADGTYNLKVVKFP